MRIIYDYSNCGAGMIFHLESMDVKCLVRAMLSLPRRLGIMSFSGPGNRYYGCQQTMELIQKHKLGAIVRGPGVMNPAHGPNVIHHYCWRPDYEAMKAFADENKMNLTIPDNGHDDWMTIKEKQYQFKNFFSFPNMSML